MLTFTLAAWLIALGAGLGFVLTRLARGAAARAGLVDVPDRMRKIQARPVPVAGGVAVLFAAVLTLVVAAFAVPDIGDALSAHPGQTLALFAAAVLITAVGLADDRFNLRARYKVLGQLAAILVLVLGGGFQIERLGLVGLVVELGPLAVP